MNKKALENSLKNLYFAVKKQVDELKTDVKRMKGTV